MYYRRYFAGTIASTTAYRTITALNGGNQSNYYEKTNVLLSAIKQTFEDVGIQCECRDTEAVLVIDGVTVQAFFNSSGYISCSINGYTLATLNSNLPFSKEQYRFYITLKGNIDGILQICIGGYSNPQAETSGFIIGKGVDLRDGKEIRVIVNGGISNPNQFYVLKDDKILEDYKNAVAFGYLCLTNVPGLNNNGADVTLVECVAQPGRFKLNNCYFGNAALTVNNFYNIGGELYYVMTANILVKCTDHPVS